MVDEQDRELWDGLLNGDPDAPRRLVDRKLARIHALAYRVLGDRSEAEDIAQETMLRTWRRPPERRPGTSDSLDAWMHRVTMNLCLDRLRRRRETPVDTLPDTIDEGAGPDRVLHSLDISDRIQATLMRLPERQREAIVLCHFQELSNIKAAEIMGLSVEAMESLLSRARRSLRAALVDLTDRGSDA
jgi:RNA polymerase sigma-70 factor (ECF subfamily)